MKIDIEKYQRLTEEEKKIVDEELKRRKKNKFFLHGLIICLIIFIFLSKKPDTVVNFIGKFIPDFYVTHSKYIEENVKITPTTKIPINAKVGDIVDFSNYSFLIYDEVVGSEYRNLFLLCMNSFDDIDSFINNISDEDKLSLDYFTDNNKFKFFDEFEKYENILADFDKNLLYPTICVRINLWQN